MVTDAEIDPNKADLIKNLYAGIDVNGIAPKDDPEDADSGPWNVVPNRKARRDYLHNRGLKQPLRSRITRKRGR